MAEAKSSFATNKFSQFNFWKDLSGFMSFKKNPYYILLSAEIDHNQDSSGLNRFKLRGNLNLFNFFLYF